ncbi:MAG: ABC transporter permease [Clostridiales bacterium]|nr:ABC transporter permease [Clostridiales bacterium]MDD6292893.1 ABC transporter permease [Eubacteriales bacterium]
MKNSIKGWKDIFSFTFIQGIKAKSIIISTAIMCAIIIAGVPIASLIGGKSETRKTSIEEVCIADMTGLKIAKDFDILKNVKSDDETENIYSKIKYTELDTQELNYDENAGLKDIYKFDKDSKKVYLQITYLEDNFDIEVIYDGKGKLESDDVDNYSNFVSDNFQKILMKNMSIADKDIEIVNSVNTINYCDIDSVKDEIDNNTDVSSNVSDDKLNADKLKDNNSLSNADEKHSKAKYNILYTMLMVTLFVLTFCGERIAMSIITEKSSKVMEYLMTSIKPMAIVVGKVLANLLIIFTQIGILAIAFLIAIFVNTLITGAKLPESISNILSRSNFDSANILSVLISILLLMGGFILFSLIAALAGASVSKMEEMSEGVKMFTFILIIGAYAAIFILSSNTYEKTSILKYAAMLFPITSVFLAPASLVTGYLSIGLGILALLIMIISNILLVRFVADVYESMIYYNGTHLKLKDIIDISKQNRNGSKRRAR